LEQRYIVLGRYIKAKDSSWDADLTGSATSTVDTKLLNNFLNLIDSKILFS